MHGGMARLGGAARPPLSVTYSAAAAAFATCGTYAIQRFTHLAGVSKFGPLSDSSGPGTFPGCGDGVPMSRTSRLFQRSDGSDGFPDAVDGDLVDRLRVFQGRHLEPRWRH